MSKFRTATLAFTALCAMAAPGSAQQAGTYSGTSADGQTVIFTVGLDSNNDLAVTGASVDFMAPCKGGTAPTLFDGWGFDTDAVITDHKAALTADFPYFYITATLKFSNKTALGFITTRTMYLDPGKAPPNRADFCESPLQAFTATFSAAGPRLPTLPPGAAIQMQPPAQH